MSKASKRPNVTRMQNAMARDREASADRRRSAWLATLSPEHHAVHERSGMCGECFGAQMRRLTAALRGEE